MENEVQGDGAAEVPSYDERGSRRPGYVPGRYDWWPGEDPAQVGFTVREAVPLDWFVLRKVLKASAEQLTRWLGYHGYSVWVFCRNRRNVVAAFVARHEHDRTTIFRYWIADPYYRKRWASGVAALIANDLPETPTSWVVRLEDAQLVKDLRADGWKVEKTSDDAGTTVLIRPPYLKVKP